MLIRTFPSVAVLSALVVALPLYAFFHSSPQTTIAGQPRTTVATATPVEAWPICTTMQSVTDPGNWAELDPDFAEGKKALVAGDWNTAIAALKLAALRDTRNADIQNYIGYGYRRLQQLEPAFAHYQKAIALNPRHRGAHEHLGEVFLVKGDLAKAEEQLAALNGICLVTCVEYPELKTAIDAYRIAAEERDRSGSSR
jgi:tetratricopeptide (TPR) repeat protein